MVDDKPRIITLDPRAALADLIADPESLKLLEEAAQMLRQGGLVAFPTETVYGLGANALDRQGVARIFEAKGRPSTNPLIVHVENIEDAKGLARSWNPAADRLARAFWPGPLTLVVPRGARVPETVSAGLDTVALRVPDHRIARALLKVCRLPLAAPSANRYMELSPTRAEHVRNGLGSAVDMIIDGGPTDVGIESTVVSVAAGEPLLLRPGMIGEEALREIVPELRKLEDLVLDESLPRSSPGLSLRHYAPQARLLILQGSRKSIEEVLRISAADPAKESFGIVAIAKKVSFLPDEYPQIILPDHPQGYAKGLYEALHRLDGEGVETIYLESPPKGLAWAAIWDRLRRAVSA